MKKDYTILITQMAPIHFELIETGVRACGYNVKLLRECTPHTVETGLKYVNNDACYPSILTTGQMIEALESGEYDPNKTALIMSQTGGGCRATNYIGFIRKALRDAGFEQVPVISFNVVGMEKNPGFKITIGLAEKLLKSVIYGDLLQKLLMKNRAYEINKGETEKLYNEWLEKCKKLVEKSNSKQFKQSIYDIVEDFEKIEINNNIPYFKEEDYTTESFERYSEWDELGRSGMAFANICKEVMPPEGEERGEIGMIKDLSGWVQKRYDNLIKDKYLYNRCHLIGWQLAGENANKKNLITKKIKIETNNIEKIIYTDQKWTQFILNQIIQNSIKYKKETDSVIICKAEEKKENVILKIIDNGIGIKEAELPKVFDKGFTGTNGRLIGKKSTGIGLYLCKNLCNKLGIAIELNSVENEGTQIQLVFPKSSYIDIK